MVLWRFVWVLHTLPSCLSVAMCFWHGMGVYVQCHTWNKAWIGNDITCTLIHKTAVSTTHQKMSQLKIRLEDLMCHRITVCWCRVQTCRYVLELSYRKLWVYHYICEDAWAPSFESARLDWIEQCFTSPPTQYRRQRDPDNASATLYVSGDWWVRRIGLYCAVFNVPSNTV